MFDFRRKSARLPLQHCQLKNHVLYTSHSMSRGVIVHLIEVFLIAMIYIYIYILYVVSLVASRLMILLYALDFSSHHKQTSRYYLDARTAFTLLCIGIKMDILNSATYSNNSIY
jgi:hypothetical protein